MDQKWLYTMEVFDEYERRFAQARQEKAITQPWEPDARARLIASAKRMIRYSEALVPQIHGMEEISRQEHPGYTAIELRYQTWPRMYGAATLYLPHGNEKFPLTFVCCGHGNQGRLSEGYMAMGHRLAALGIAALVPDNIGQGDRNPHPEKKKGPDHWYADAPFACGLSLQGLIVMETVALIRYLQQDPRFDAQRFAACGNSGGGTLTMFLSALAPELSAIASCGYPSDATYLMQKERRHCACNLLIGQAYEAEMWELYSLFAPKPLLLESGNFDNLMPVDLFHRTARKVKNTYLQLSSPEHFQAALTNTKHPWELEDINTVSRFLAQKLLNRTPEDATELFRADSLDPFRVPMPRDRLTTAQLAQMLSGCVLPEVPELHQIFPPTYQGKPLDPANLVSDVGRGDVMRVFSQYECVLQKPTR